MTDSFNEYAKKHGARKEVWDEGLKLKYQNKSMREYSASIYGLPYQEFPLAAFTSEAAYLQWCVSVSGVMPDKRKTRAEFHRYIQERLSEAEEEEIPPNTEEGVEVGVVVLTILKSKARIARNFDVPQEHDQLLPGEWLFLETAEDSRCGLEVFIKYEGLRACIVDQIAVGNTETKLTRKEVVAWLRAHGRYYDRKASVNRRRCAYILPYALVENFEIFSLRNRVLSAPSVSSV
jgi:hypothetical protein